MSRLHVGVTRVAEDAAAAERARTELHPPLKPADDGAARDLAGDHVDKGGLVVDALVLGVDGLEKRLNLAV